MSKNILLFCTLALLTISSVRAEQPFKEDRAPRPEVNTITVVGAVLVGKMPDHPNLIVAKDVNLSAEYNAFVVANRLTAQKAIRQVAYPGTQSNVTCRSVTKAEVLANRKLVQPGDKICFDSRIIEIDPH